MKILFHGNCQSQTMAEALKRLTHHEIRATSLPLRNISSSQIHEIREFARTADLIISMPVSNDLVKGIGTLDLLEISRCPFVIHPNIHFEGHCPTFDYIRGENRQHVLLKQSAMPPFASYFCYLIYLLWRDGFLVRDSIRMLSAPIYIGDVLFRLDESIRRLESKEDYAASAYKSIRETILFRVSPYVRSCEIGAFDTFNHPSANLLTTIFKELIDFCSDFCRHEVLPSLTLPPNFVAIKSKEVFPVYSFISKSLIGPSHSGFGDEVLSSACQHVSRAVEQSYLYFQKLDAEDHSLVNRQPRIKRCLQYKEVLVSCLENGV